MPEGEGLFDILDAALARQREGQEATAKPKGGGRKKAATPRKQASGQAAALSPTPPPPQAPVAPAAPVAPVAPVRPVSDRVQAPPPRPSGPIMSPVSERLSHVPDSARTAPPAGVLSPGQVLRGTVFSSRTPSERAAAEAATRESQRPGTTRTTPSSVLSPPPAAPVQPPANSAVLHGGSTVIRSGPVSGISTTSTRATAAPAHTESRGFFVSTEVAVVALLLAIVALVTSFFLGVRIGRRDAQRGGKSGKPVARGEEGGPEGGGKKVVDPDGLRGAPMGIGEGPGEPVIKPVGAVASPSKGKWTVEVMRYTERSAAERLVDELTGQGITGVGIVERVVRRRRELSVCVGRFDSRNDEQAGRIKETIIRLNRTRYTGRVEIIELK